MTCRQSNNLEALVVDCVLLGIIILFFLGVPIFSSSVILLFVIYIFNFNFESLISSLPVFNQLCKNQSMLILV